MCTYITEFMFTERPFCISTLFSFRKSLFQVLLHRLLRRLGFPNGMTAFFQSMQLHEILLKMIY